MKPTAEEMLCVLIRVADGADRLRREEAARDALRILRARFGEEYRAMAAELRARGTEPRQTEDEYAERKFAQMFPAEP